jgi:site-specific recombinase XerD
VKTSKGGSFEPLTEIKRTWSSVCETASLEDIRLHDLRHGFASVLASAGLNLPIVGPLLGHSQPRTAARYAHLYDDALPAATERVGAIVTGGDLVGADVVPMARLGR